MQSLLERCTFPTPGTRVQCAWSAGPDSTALVVLAMAAGLEVTAHHVDHGIRADSAGDAALARTLAERLGVGLEVHRIDVPAGPNLEDRARRARAGVLPAEVMTGHTADDQAETVLLRLLRGSGATGLGAMVPGHRRPLLRLRRTETHEVCRLLGLEVADDETNRDPAFRRNRVRAELLPLANDVAGRDVTPLLVRTADLVRDDDALLDELAADLDPTDAAALRDAPVPLARRAVRGWLATDGYPPDAATVERVLEVARGAATGCEIGGGRAVRRTAGRLRVAPSAR